MILFKSKFDFNSKWTKWASYYHMPLVAFNCKARSKNVFQIQELWLNTSIAFASAKFNSAHKLTGSKFPFGEKLTLPMTASLGDGVVPWVRLWNACRKSTFLGHRKLARIGLLWILLGTKRWDYLKRVIQGPKEALALKLIGRWSWKSLEISVDTWERMLL